MNQLRLILIAVGCLIGGPVLLVRGFTPLPSLEKLEKVSGIVRFDTGSRSTRRSRTEYPVLTIAGVPTRFAYLDWFPRSNRLTSLVRAGENVTIWTDRGRHDWVWQIEQGGQVIIPYAEVRNAIQSNEQWNWLFGCGLIALGIVVSVKLYREHALA